MPICTLASLNAIELGESLGLGVLSAFGILRVVDSATTSGNDKSNVLARLLDELQGLLQQSGGIDPFVLGIGIGKMIADIAQSCGTQQGVGHSM